MKALILAALLLTAGIHRAQTAPRLAPVQIEWTVRDDMVIWMDCWPSDGQTDSDVWVYLVYQEGTAPYVCTVTDRLWIRPAPHGSGPVSAKAVR